MRMIIDRLEGNFAVCENEEGEMRTVGTALLPKQARPGDVLVYEDGGWRVDAQETARRRARIQKKLDSLWETE